MGKFKTATIITQKDIKENIFTWHKKKLNLRRETIKKDQMVGV